MLNLPTVVHSLQDQAETTLAFAAFCEKLRNEVGGYAVAFIHFLLLEAMMNPDFFFMKYGYPEQPTLNEVRRIGMDVNSIYGVENFTEGVLSPGGIALLLDNYLQLAVSGGLKPKDTTKAGTPPDTIPLPLLS
jgi:hypothetical protein